MAKVAKEALNVCEAFWIRPYLLLTPADWPVDNQQAQTPSTHRQRLAPGNAPTPRIGMINMQPNSVAGTPMPRTGTGRSPLASLNANSTVGPGFAGYGMSAGLKVSNPAGSSVNGFSRPFVRSRGLYKVTC